MEYLVSSVRSSLAGSAAAHGEQVIVSVSQNDLAGSGKACAAYPRGPSKPSSLVRFLPVFQYLLELTSGVWVLECGVLTSPRA